MVGMFPIAQGGCDRLYVKVDAQVIAGDMEALAKVVELHAKWVGDAHVVAIVRATLKCGLLLILFSGSSLQDHVIIH